METTLISLAYVLLSIVFLWKGSDWTVDKASALAARYNISEVTIGVTVIAFGTSLPELAASLTSAIKQHGDLALSNVVGSNIFNLGIILGLAVIVAPLNVRRESLLRDGLLLLGISLFLVLSSMDLHLGRVTGLILLLLMGGYIIALLRQYGAQRRITPRSRKASFTATDGIKLLLGLGMVVTGGHLIVEGALGIGAAMGIQEWALGLSVTAFGTSLPEIVVCISSVIKRKQDILFGNLLGSDVFNFCGVLGLACLTNPFRVSPDALMGLLMLTGSYILLLLFMRSGWRLARGEGVVILLISLFREIYFFL
ncbi:MAG: calcium/sodium antiporter [Desulfohalobiaceae bacterium]|nr:calcium/sodium antiporter [Desulfohalobiaceae bacterium]